MPFAVERSDGILRLTLDTPAPVNIFDRATAEQTIELLADVNPETTRAIVFRTAKRTSFINGAGVLLSTSVKSHEDVMRISAPFRRAYLAVRAAPVPTIAIVEGMCWGCGVEFLLNCRHRLAADSHDTQFRMTELEDYLEVPIFRATANLPPAVGLPEAIDLLLWGARWTARQALERGLVEELADPSSFEEVAEDFVDRVLAGGVRPMLGIAGGAPSWSPADDEALARARRRIDDLPPAIQRPYRDALTLLEDGARHEAGQAHFEANERATSESACSPHAKQAYGFFHIRQTAAMLATRGDTSHGEVRVAFDGFASADEERPLHELLLPPRPLAAAPVVESGQSSGPWARFVPLRAADGRSVAVALAPVAAPPAGPVLHRPLPGVRFVELREPEKGTLRPLATYLRRLRFEVALSDGADTLGSALLLGRFIAPLATALLAGERVETIERTLRAFGIARRPAVLLAGVPIDALVEIARPFIPGRVRAGDLRAAMASLVEPTSWELGEARWELISAVVVSCLAAATDNLDKGGFRHPTIIDLAARELLDFPLEHRSLCSYLVPSRVAEALAVRGISGLVDEASLANAEQFVASRRRFYR